MDPKKIIQNVIPNPLSSQSTLSSTAKGAELLKEGLSFRVIITNVIFLLVVSLIMAVYFKMPVPIVAILIGTEILITLIAGYIKIRMLKSIYAIGTENNGQSYRTLLITREYYELIKAIFGFAASIVSVAIIFLFFFDEISNFVIQNIPANIPLRTDFFKYFILIFALYGLFDLVMRLIRYGAIRKLKLTSDWAKVNQEYVVIEGKLGLIKLIPVMGVFLLVFFLLGIPANIIFVFIGVMLIIIALAVIELLRVQRVQLNDQGIDKSVIQHQIEEYPQEQILGSVFGIMKTSAGLKDIFKPAGVAVLGVGEYYYPENTLLITNLRLIMVQVPLPGGNKIVGGMDYVPQNFLFDRGELKQKGTELLETKTLPQILKLALNDVLYKDIKALTLNQGQVTVEKLSGEKLSYVYLDKEYFEPLKKLFQDNLKERFIVS